jgi:hypothetical protein
MNELITALQPLASCQFVTSNLFGDFQPGRAKVTARVEVTAIANSQRIFRETDGIKCSCGFALRIGDHTHLALRLIEDDEPDFRLGRPDDLFDDRDSSMTDRCGLGE